MSASSEAGGGAPALTLVVADSGPGPAGEPLARAVAPWVRAGRLRVLVVSEAEPELGAAGWAVEWVPAPAGSTVPSRRALGLRRTDTPLVALTESFCVPERGWLDAVLDGLSDPAVDAVGGRVVRRDGAAAAWALTLFEYGRYLDPRAEGPTHDLGCVNAAYRRDVLAAALNGLPDEILEGPLHRRLLDAGRTLRRIPGAVMVDTSARGFGWAWRAQRSHGRLFGGTRVAGAPVPVRIGRALVAPLVPLVLFGRVARSAVAAGYGSALVRSAPLVAGLAVAWALGEAVGSLRGPGDAASAWR